jgi:hypothetical protein
MPRPSIQHHKAAARLRGRAILASAVVLLVSAQIANRSPAVAAPSEATADPQPSATLILVMSGLAGILIGMSYGAVRAVIRRIRAGRRSRDGDVKAVDPGS